MSKRCAARGLAPEIVSAGGTGTFDIAGKWPDVTEVQAGSYVFMDGAYRKVRPDLGRPALTLLATVISRRGERAIIDAGMKSLTNEFGPPMGKDTEIKVARLSEEHGHLAAGESSIEPGSKIEIVPSHNDTTINLHSEYYVVRGDEVIATWPIEGCARVSVSIAMRKAGHRAIAALAIAVAIGGFAQAAEVKMAGKLNAPANASVIAICTDPVVQNVLNEDLRAARHGQPSNPGKFGDAHGDGESANAGARSVVESDVPGRSLRWSNC